MMPAVGAPADAGRVDAAVAAGRRRRLGRSGRAKSAALAAALAAVALVALTACTPLYLPPLPGDALVAVSHLRLDGSSRLDQGGGGASAPLVLTLDVLEVPEDGWLAVQWFAPAGGAVASESVWLTPSDAGSSRSVTTPADVTLRPGEWRAVVSWYGRIVRQFRYDVL
jgi:hypothetical protein